MTTFIALAAVIALAAGIAIAWPIIRSRKASGMGEREANLAVLGDQAGDLDGARDRGEISMESHARAIDELKRRVAEDVDAPPGSPGASRSWRLAGWIAAACVPAVAALVYVVLGNPRAIDVPAGSPPREAPHALAGAQVAGMADQLAARLRENPEDAEGWATLGRSLAAVGRFAEAADALGEAARRAPANAGVLADRADVLAMAQGRRFDGEPDRLIAQALAADPRHVKAIALAGTSAFERGDYAVAARHWRRLLSMVPAQSETARQVEARAREAERRAETGSTTALTGTVTFADGQAVPMGPADAIFVIARPRDGRGRPVAVARLKPSSLPAPFRLDDGNSLVASSPLSGHSEVLLEARLARNGSAEPRPGDPRSVPRAARPGERAIALELRASAL